ncbi:MAG: hypothetical protein RMM58_12910 [Chloroflexota bacterium]|nr:hypothetical protein [Dehalococcoidia bacterium]MDW8254770.1 hypothetical protein [Chloroflexota bacterium]
MLLDWRRHDHNARHREGVDRALLPLGSRVEHVLDLARALGRDMTAQRKRLPHAEGTAALMARDAHKRAVGRWVDDAFARLRRTFGHAVAAGPVHEGTADAEVWRALQPGRLFITHDVGRARGWPPLGADRGDTSGSRERGCAAWGVTGARDRAGFRGVEWKALPLQKRRLGIPPNPQRGAAA